MKISAYIINEEKESKLFANEFLDIIGRETKTYQSFEAYAVLNDYLAQEEILVELISTTETEFNKNLNDVQLALVLEKLYSNLTGVYYYTERFKKAIEYGEKAIKIQYDYGLEKNKLLYIRLEIAYGKSNDIKNSNKYNKLHRAYFPDYEVIDYRNELNVLLAEGKVKEFVEQFRQYENDLIERLDFKNLIVIYSVAIELYGNSHIFTKNDIDIRISIITDNFKFLDKETKALWDMNLSQYFLFCQNYLGALDITKRYTNSRDPYIKLSALSGKSTAEAFLGLNTEKQTSIKAFKLAQEIYGNKSPKILPYAQLVMATNLDESEIKYANLALQIIYDNNLEKTKSALSIWNSLGYTAYNLGNLIGAETYFKKALAFFDNEYPISINVYTHYSCLLGLARVNISKEKFNEAEEYLDQTYQVITQSKNMNNAAYADYYEAMSDYYYNIGDYEMVKECLEKAQGVVDDKFLTPSAQKLLLVNYYNSDNIKPIEEHYYKNGDLVNLSYIIYIDKFNKLEHNEARNFLLKDLKDKVNSTKGSFHLLSYFEQEEIFSKFQDNFEFLNTHLLLCNSNNFLKEYIALRFYYKGLLSTSNKSFKSKEDSLYINEYRNNNELISIYLESKEDYKKEIEELNIRNRELEKLLSIKQPINESPSFKDIQNLLNEDEAFIEIVRINKQKKHPNKSPNQISNFYTDSIYYGAIMIRNNGAPNFVLIDDENKLEDKSIDLYTSYISGEKKSQLDPISYKLYFKPLEKHLNGIKKIYFSPDGIYNSINVENFYNPVLEMYIGEYLSINQVISARSLFKEGNTEPIFNKTAILIGNPSFKVSRNQQEGFVGVSDAISRNIVRGTGTNNILNLPGTENEVNSIQAALKSNNWTVKLYRCEEASETNLKAVNSPYIVHIATHGFFYDNTKKRRHTKNFLGYSERKVRNNDLLRSGILLAGAQNSIDGEVNLQNNGIFTAQEAKNLNLTNTELVTLSACETGLGENKVGDGIYGLQRAFMIAGAKSIIMSLWKVDDNATQKLMSLFYSNWIKKDMSKHEALRQAKLELKSNYPEPYYWSGFVLIE